MFINNFRNKVKKNFPDYKSSKLYNYYKTSKPYLKLMNYKLMEFQNPKIKQLTKVLETNDPIIFYSIGARYGLPCKFANYLRDHKFLFGIGFEPDREEAQHLKDDNLFDVIMPYALGSENGTHTLNITEHPGCSSILFPHAENLNLFCEYPEWFNLKDKIDIKVHRLDEIIKAEKIPSPDILQIDTQGFEFEVLRGSTNILNQVSIIELEVQMYPIYLGQKTFADIHDFLTEHGFVMLLIEKSGVFGINYVEANVCYFNKSLVDKSQKSRLLIDYCSIAHEIDLLKVA